jgi:hypothetical protein
LADITDRRDRHDMSDRTLAAEPIDKIDAADPTDPIDRTDPIDPIESTDPFDPMHKNESSDHNERVELLVALAMGASVSRQWGIPSARAAEPAIRRPADHPPRCAGE